ncbi:MAG: hypothetical protein AAGB93_05795 [Planctomycetota bacterium]
MLLRAVPLALLALAVSAPASAQFMNRAVYLGFEDEGFRRDYRQDREYFVDRYAIIDQPPWWRGTPEAFNPFQNRFSLAGGSVSSDELSLESTVNVGVDLGRGTTLRANYLASENQSTRFTRFAVGMDFRTSESSSFFFQLEGDAGKDRADGSLGVEFLRSDHGAHRLMFTAVDWSTGKSDVFEYDDKPYGVMLSGYRGRPDGVRFLYDVGAQLPFTERTIATSETFQMNRTIGLFEVRVPVSEDDEFVIGFDGELTAKEARQPDPASILREDGDVQRGRVRAEWWRRRSSGRDSSLGFWLHGIDEDYERPNDPAESRRVRRREAMLTGRMRFPFNPTWSVEPYVLAGYVDLTDRVGGATGDLDFEGFQGQAGIPLRYTFSDFALVRLDLSMQLDKFAFGGGALQVEARF